MKAFFISIPHSGERVPPEAAWLQGLPEPVLMCDVDRYVDQLYSPIVKNLQLACVTSQWHRYMIDLNRLPDDVDADSVAGHANPPGRFTTGLHWVKTTRGSRILPEPISEKLHNQLIAKYFEPFHSDVRDTYGFFREKGAKKVYHLDAHSMPSKGTAAHRDPGETRADIVVSDCEGKSCEPEYKELVMNAYRETGLKVAYNWPYVGGRVIQTYGLPERGQHAIQVEINRALYMDEETKLIITDKAEKLIEKISQAVAVIHQQLADL